jgi:transcriptional regulator GlxA family with amidase domain
MVEERLATGAEHGLFQDAGGGAGRATEPCFGRVRPVCDQVRAAVAFLREHHCEKVTLEVLARRVGLSRSQLAALFAEQIGKTPNAYQRLLRVRHMAELLRETELSVESVCREVGWADPSKAARVFKEATTMTPSEYRRKFAHPLPGPAGRAGHRPEQADRPINQADRLVFRA